MIYFSTPVLSAENESANLLESIKEMVEFIVEIENDPESAETILVATEMLSKMEKRLIDINK